MAALGAAKWGNSVRVLDLGGWECDERPIMRQVSGGFLIQDPDQPSGVLETKTVTDRSPDDAEYATLRFAWQVCKHVRSNAIVLARSDGSAFHSVAVGAGQMSRVDAVVIAVNKAGDQARGSVLASDAFFPFADGLEAAAAAGVVAVIQPGGSRRDDEVIAAANGADMAMVFTGRRHFRH